MDVKLLQLAVQNLSDRLDKLEKENKELKAEVQELKRMKMPLTKDQSQKDVELNEFLTLKEAISLLKISRSGFLRMVEDGILIPIRMNLRTLRYSKREILEFMNQR